jgi:hypothetical protein
MRKRALELHLCILFVACLVFFKLNWNAMFLGYDGAGMMALVKFNFEWSEIWKATSLNPLTGLADIKFGHNFWCSIPTVIAWCLADGHLSPPLIYAVTTIELFLSIWILSRVLGLSPFQTAFASWTGAVMCMPFVTPVMKGFLGFYAISGLLPYLMEEISILCLLTSVVLSLERGKARRNAWLGLAALLLVLLLVFQFPTQFVLTVPVLIGNACVALRTLFEGRKSLKPLAATALAGGLVLVQPALFSIGMLIWSVAAFFSNEIQNTDHGHPQWEFISMVAHGPMGMGWANTIIYLLALMGALVSQMGSSPRLKRLSSLYLVVSVCVFVFGCLVAFWLKQYKGVLSMYFEWMLWPYMFVFSAVAISRGFSLCFEGGQSSLSEHEKDWVFRMHRRWLYPFQAYVPLGYLALVLIFNQKGSMQDFQKPPANTTLVDFFRANVGLAPGSPWRGSVANFCALGNKAEGVSWPNQQYYDFHLWGSAGNDHRGPGLWWHNIPTLFVYHQCMSPSTYYFISRLLGRPEDKNIRNIVLVSKPDPKILGLFGVKYFIDDLPAPSEWKGCRSVGAFTWMLRAANQNVAQHVTELERCNLSGFSPTEILRAASASQTVERLKQPSFDPHTQVVLRENLDAKLVPCKSSELIWGKDGARFKAESEGTSLVVLPIGYSTCIRMRAVSGGSELKARTLRADGALLGVVFSGSVDVVIEQNFGPFSNATGRFADYRDFKSFLGSN